MNPEKLRQHYDAISTEFNKTFALKSVELGNYSLAYDSAESIHAKKPVKDRHGAIRRCKTNKAVAAYVKEARGQAEDASILMGVVTHVEMLVSLSRLAVKCEARGDMGDTKAYGHSIRAYQSIHSAKEKPPKDELDGITLEEALEYAQLELEQAGDQDGGQGSKE